jgi:hypothetical protein
MGSEISINRSQMFVKRCAKRNGKSSVCCGRLCLLDFHRSDYGLFEGKTSSYRHGIKQVSATIRLNMSIWSLEISGGIP